MIWRRIKKVKKEDEEKFSQMMEEQKPSGKDIFAMILSALFVIVLPCALVLVGLSLLVLLLFGVL